MVLTKFGLPSLTHNFDSRDCIDKTKKYLSMSYYYYYYYYYYFIIIIIIIISDKKKLIKINF